MLWRCNNSFCCRSQRSSSSSRDDFTGSFFARLCIDCSIIVDDCCVPVILCLILSASFAWFFFFFFCEAHTRVCEWALWLCNYGFSWVGFPVHICATLYTLQLHCCLACKFLLLSFSSVLPFSCNFWSSPSLTSHLTMYSSMPLPTLYNLLFHLPSQLPLLLNHIISAHLFSLVHWF